MIIKRKFNFILILTLLFFLFSSTAFASPVTFSSGTTIIALSSPVVDLSIISGSVADQLVVNAGNIAVSMSSTTGGTFAFTSPYAMSYGTSGSGGSVNQTCSSGIETDTITQTSASEVFTFTPTGSGCSGTTVPGGPTGATAIGGNAQATVTFTAPASNGGAAIDGYTVTSSPSGGTDTNASTTGLSHVITGLANGTPYTFTVTAHNSVGNSAPSAPSNSVTPATVPGAPTGATAIGGNAQATVTFTAPASNGGAAIDGYTVTSSPSGGTDTNASTTGLSHVITGLANGTPYTFTVTAHNSVGTSSSSTSSNSVTPNPAPATTFSFSGPSSGVINVSSGSFTVTPNNPYTGTITITPTGSASTGLSPTVLTFSNSAVAQTFTITPTVTGTVTLTPTNNGSLTNPSTVVYTVGTVPVVFGGVGASYTSPTVSDAPTGATAVAGDAQATVTFAVPDTDGGAAISGYTVTSIPAGGTDANASTTGLSHIITGLTNGTSYTFTVTADNSIGNSASSSPSNAVTPAATTIPTIITPNTTITSGNNIPGCNGNVGSSTINGESCAGNVSVTATTNPAASSFAGCNGNLGFSTTSGQSCAGNPNPAASSFAGCNGNLGFSTTSGQSCAGNPNPAASSTTTTTVSPTIPTTTTSPQTYNFGSITLAFGSQGDAVKELQQFLNASIQANLPITGNFANKTLAAVKEWQTNNGLTADGIVGPQTKALMNGQSTSANNPTPASPTTPIITPTIPTTTTSPQTYNFGSITLAFGSQGDAVKELQQFLNASIQANLPITGNFANKTLAAVKEWQTNNGLTADGIVGPQTKALMNK